MRQESLVTRKSFRYPTRSIPEVIIRLYEGLPHSAELWRNHSLIAFAPLAGGA